MVAAGTLVGGTVDAADASALVAVDTGEEVLWTGWVPSGEVHAIASPAAAPNAPVLKNARRELNVICGPSQPTW
jgi:hypothetical protein